MAVRSNYIKSLMETKKTLEEQMQEVVSESMKGIIGDNAKDEVRKLLKESEDEDSFSEEEVTDDTATTDEDETTEVDVTTDTTDEDGEDVITDTVDVETTEDGDTEDTVEDDVWNELEKCKSADGEFDCRGMDDENLLKVLKAMGPEDGIRVMKNDDGTIAVEVDGDLIQGEEEFIIDLDDLFEDGGRALGGLGVVGASDMRGGGEEGGGLQPGCSKKGEEDEVLFHIGEVFFEKSGEVGKAGPVVMT